MTSLAEAYPVGFGGYAPSVQQYLGGYGIPPRTNRYTNVVEPTEDSERIRLFNEAQRAERNYVNRMAQQEIQHQRLSGIDPSNPIFPRTLGDENLDFWGLRYAGGPSGGEIRSSRGLSVWSSQYEPIIKNLIEKGYKRKEIEEYLGGSGSRTWEDLLGGVDFSPELDYAYGRYSPSESYMRNVEQDPNITQKLEQAPDEIEMPSHGLSSLPDFVGYRRIEKEETPYQSGLEIFKGEEPYHLSEEDTEKEYLNTRAHEFIHRAQFTSGYADILFERMKDVLDPDLANIMFRLNDMKPTEYRNTLELNPESTKHEILEAIAAAYAFEVSPTPITEKSKWGTSIEEIIRQKIGYYEPYGSQERSKEEMDDIVKAMKILIGDFKKYMSEQRESISEHIPFSSERYNQDIKDWSDVGLDDREYLEKIGLRLKPDPKRPRVSSGYPATNFFPDWEEDIAPLSFPNQHKAVGGLTGLMGLRSI